jgi:hypothetical protein
MQALNNLLMSHPVIGQLVTRNPELYNTLLSNTSILDAFLNSSWIWSGMRYQAADAEPQSTAEEETAQEETAEEETAEEDADEYISDADAETEEEYVQEESDQVAPTLNIYDIDTIILYAGEANMPADADGSGEQSAPDDESTQEEDAPSDEPPSDTEAESDEADEFDEPTN